MFLSILAFLAGDMCLQTFSQLPSMFYLYVMLMSGLFFCWCGQSFRTFGRLVFAFLFGITWSCWMATNTLSWVLPKEQEGKPQLITGYIASIPEKNSRNTSFTFLLNKTHHVVQLAWQDASASLHVGDQWQLLVSLKRIHGTQNPGAYDSEAGALQKGLRAKGSVIANQKNLYLSHNIFRYPIEQLREWLLEKIQACMPATAGSHWLKALMVGDRRAIPQEEWQVLRRTGTNHLMAIAGLHIGVIAGFIHFIVNWCWRLSPRLLYLMPAQQASVCAAVFAGILYSALAGFPLPTQRACFMLMLFGLLFVLRRQSNPWQVWILAMGMVLILNPLSVLTESFWLSFGTLALIIYGMGGRLSPSGWWWKWGRVQWVIAVGLIPLSLSQFGEVSLVSFIANCIAIPWLAFFILPFCFLGTIAALIFPWLGKGILLLAGVSLSGLWWLLTWFASLPLSAWSQAMPSTFIYFISIGGCLLLLLPAGAPGRWLGFLWLMPLFFYQPDKPKQGELWLTLLDVGQGLSVVVQTATHSLVYDTGEKIGPIDMGERVLLPFLRTVGIKKVDMLVVSHGDNDHIGGAASLMHHLPIIQIKTSVPEKLPTNHTNYCLAGDSWMWDGIRFSFLHPTREDLGFGNDSSCVLRIEQGEHAVLLTGDIEKLAEQHLLTRASSLTADILVAPHHGSKTSGIREFIEAVHPRYVLYAVGYRNRYHFPHPSVMKAYQDLHVQQVDSVHDGAIQFKMGELISEPVKYRLSNKRYWFD